MKNLITLSLTIGILSSLLFSCGSSLTVTKRHYNKGYHISYNKIPKSVDNKDEEKLISKTESYSTSNNTRETVNQTEEIAIEKEIASVSASQEDVSEMDLDDEEKTSIAKFDFKQEFGKVANTTQESVSKIKSSLSDKYVSIENSSPRSEDGLSMVWIIILVILILWALGFGFGGLGNLIHLLLVVALILLILWLLGVI